MKALKGKIKEAIIVILLGGLVSVIPFYFETKAMTEDNHRLNIRQDEAINELMDETEQIKLDQALGQSEIRHNKEILLRIEKKLDDLKKEVKTLN